MSRIGNRILLVPEGIKVDLGPSHISLSKGNDQLVVKFRPNLVAVSVQEHQITTKRLSSNKESHMQQGTINSLINNAIKGLTVGFSKKLLITGVGYKAAMSNNQLTLNLGYSHPIVLTIPAKIQLKLASPTEIHLSSYDKELLGEFAAQIRKHRRPEPYKGKGIAYSDEQILRKVGKTSEGGKKK